MNSTEIKYCKVVKTLTEEIGSGKYAFGKRFPSVAMLIRRFGISNMTAVKVLDKLKVNGLVCSYQGRGTFVTKLAASRKIGLIVPGMAVVDFYLPIVREINELAHREGYTLFFKEVFASDRGERIRQVRELASMFVKERMSGVIYEPLAGPTGTDANDFVMRVLDRAKIPVVLLDCDIVPFPDRSGHDVIGTNDIEAGAKLVRHLLQLGARRIHFLMGSSVPTTFCNRLYGVRSAIHEWGRKCETTVLRADPTDVMAVKRHFRKYGRPDAFMCSNDLNAAVLTKTLEKLGVFVPKDMLLTGFADLPIASLMTPRLTTMRQSREQMGRLAFRRLLERIADPTLPSNEILFPAQLVVRESTKRPSAGPRAAR